MRFVYLLILLAFVGAVTAFAAQNTTSVAVNFIDRSATVSVPALVGVVYVLGMLSGWTVVGLLRRSLRSVTDGPLVRG